MTHIQEVNLLAVASLSLSLSLNLANTFPFSFPLFLHCCQTTVPLLSSLFIVYYQISCPSCLSSLSCLSFCQLLSLFLFSSSSIPSSLDLFSNNFLFFFYLISFILLCLIFLQTFPPLLYSCTITYILHKYLRPK